MRDTVNQEFKISMFDKDNRLKRDDFLGQVQLSLSELLALDSKSEWFPLRKANNKGETRGSLRIGLQIRYARDASRGADATAPAAVTGATMAADTVPVAPVRKSLAPPSKTPTIQVWPRCVRRRAVRRRR